MEYRGSEPPSRAEVDEHIAALVATGVEATWHSAVDPDSRPLFPSEVFPDHHPQASLEAFRYLVDRAHAAGLPIISWYSLNRGGGVLSSHPDWQMQVLPWPKEPDPEVLRKHACINSPYGDLLPKFSAEVVSRVGFDGLWFDGAVFGLHSNEGGNPGCVCERCRQRFRRDTGHSLPERVDWDNRIFKEWVHWRYDVFMELWKRIVDAVHEVKPGAVVAFNNYRRHVPSGHCWQTGIPMRRLGWEMLCAGELDLVPGQADAQIKYYRSYECTQGVESWQALCDYWNMWAPDVELLPPLQAALGCLSAGGVASFGIGVKINLVKDLLRTIENEVAPRMAYLGGQPVEYAAIVASQSTMDFAGRDDPIRIWDQLHGANELCRHAHLLTSWVFDDHVDEGGECLARFPVLLVGDMTCVSKRQAASLEQYVRAGGVLVACAEAGTLDEWGERRDQGALDSLLGIVDRTSGTGKATLHITDHATRASAGAFVSFQAAHALSTPVEDVKVVAGLVEHTGYRKPDWTVMEKSFAEGKPTGNPPGLWHRRVGRGQVIYSCVDLFGAYLAAPTVQILRLVRHLLMGSCIPAVTLDGPMAVTLNARWEGLNRIAVHLHNAPGSLHSHVVCPRGYGLHAMGEVNPVFDLTLQLNGLRAVRAESAISGQVFAVAGEQRVSVPRLDLHDVVLITLANKR